MSTGRQCPKCKRVDPACGFTPNPWRAQCRECVRARMRSWDKSKKEQDPIGYAKQKHDQYLKYDKPGLRSRHLQKTYGLTGEQVAQMYENQEGLCAICSRLMDITGRRGTRACVDHDHRTGIVRGLLCAQCNTGLGSFDDSPASLKSAINYLGRVLVQFVGE